MEAWRLYSTGEVLRCIACEEPGYVVVHDVPECIRKKAEDVVYCQKHGEDIVVVMRKALGTGAIAHSDRRDCQDFLAALSGAMAAL